VDLNKLTTGDKVIGGSALVFLISMFLPWYDFTAKASLGGLGSTTIAHGGGRNGFHYFFTGWLPFLLLIGIVVCIYLQRFTDVKLPDLPITWDQVYTTAALLVAVLVLLRILVSDGHSAILTVHFKGNRKIGVYLAFVATIGLVVGAVMNMRAETPAGGGDATPPPPAPPAPPTA
jgi:hypothetical protein